MTRKGYNFLALGLCLLLFFIPIFAKAVTVEITATVAGCGDGVIGIGEQCDTTEFGGATCSSLGFTGGTLACDLSCSFNTTSCYHSSPSGGSVFNNFIPLTNVIFSGFAYPNSQVVLLKDGQIIATTFAETDGQFQIAISNLSTGDYRFSLYTKDHYGIRSSLFTFATHINAQSTTKISNILLAPSIAINKQFVKQNESIKVSGHTVPNAVVTIVVDAKSALSFETMASNIGDYSLMIDLSNLEIGRHTLRASAEYHQRKSDPSNAISFFISSGDVIEKQSGVQWGGPKGDLNNDNKVNLIDFYIARYWYKKQLSDLFSEIEYTQLNGDKKIDLFDFSIIAFNWTG